MQRDFGHGFRHEAAPLLTAVFIDYDNVYLSLKRTSEDAAQRFAKDTARWLKAIETGELITATQSGSDQFRRRLVMNRCYGNPMPRKSGRDNTTDSNSFTFIRHHFLRAGFEVIDCPPLTAQLKNASDIRMVMDIRDFLTHETYFDEFVILSGDADFTPVLHRLRAHARRTVIFASGNTVDPYKAISDGEIREQDLIAFLLGEQHGANEDELSHGDGDEEMPAPPVATAPASRMVTQAAPIARAAEPPRAMTFDFEQIRRDIIDVVKASVMRAEEPVSVESLAELAQHQLGAERTLGTQWAGAGSLRALLAQHLPHQLRLTETPPYRVYGVSVGAAIEELSRKTMAPSHTAAPVRVEPTLPMPALAVSMSASPVAAASQTSNPVATPPMRGRPAMAMAQPAEPLQPPRPQPLREQPGRIEQSIARIHDACQAPPLAPPDYRVLFDAMSAELMANGLHGQPTIAAIVARCQSIGVEVRPEDVRMVLDVVREADPWFERGASAAVLASRFRNYVVSRCRARGLALSTDEVDLIDAWFTASEVAAAARPAATQQRGASGPIAALERQADEWWSASQNAGSQIHGEDVGAMPRIVRARGTQR